MALSYIGNISGFMRFSMFSAFGGLTCYYLLNARTRKKVTEKDLIIVTGCDSGLGFSIASHCHNNMNMTVIACVKSLNSKGSEMLKNILNNSPLKNSTWKNKSTIIELDITDENSVKNLLENVQEILKENPSLNFYGLVNNAGQMVMGEIEWHTDNLIDTQLDVNLRGTIRMSKTFLPLARRYKSRIINVSSHCGLRTLPGISIYSTSKAGVRALTEGLRLELMKYEVEVTSFIPGGFVMQSNLMARQNEHAKEMREALSEEQRNFYGDYFDRYNEYLSYIPSCGDPVMVDREIINRFVDSLVESPPKPVYLFEPIRYAIYHLLFKLTPQGVCDWLICKFVAMPEYDPSKSVKN